MGKVKQMLRCTKCGMDNKNCYLYSLLLSFQVSTSFNELRGLLHWLMDLCVFLSPLSLISLSHEQKREEQSIKRNTEKVKKLITK